MDKLSMNAKIALAGFVGVIVSVFLAYVKPDEGYGDSRSLHEMYATSSDDGGFDAAIWIYLLLALAVVGAYLVYSKKAALGLLAGGLVFGFLGASYILLSKAMESQNGVAMGIGAYLGLAAGAVAVYGAYRALQEK